MRLSLLLYFSTSRADPSLSTDPLTAKYTRLNKSGIITSSPITSVLWLPPSPAYSSNENHSNLFLTSHIDGTMLIWDKDREDWSGFTPTAVPTGISIRAPSLGGGKENDWASSINGDGSFAGSDSKHAPTTAGLLPGMGDIVVSRPAPTDKKGGTTTKFNPVSHWRVSKKAITGRSSSLAVIEAELTSFRIAAFAFSPDLQLCATVGEDGCLRIINAAEEKCGALHLLWSPALADGPTAAADSSIPLLGTLARSPAFHGVLMVASWW